MCLNPKGSTENTHTPQLSFGMLGVPRLFSSLLETNSCQLVPWSVNLVRLKSNIQSSPAFFFCKSLLFQDEQLSVWPKQIQIMATLHRFLLLHTCCYKQRGQPGKDNILGQFKGPKVVSSKARSARNPILCTGNTHKCNCLKSRVLLPGCKSWASVGAVALCPTTSSLRHRAHGDMFLHAVPRTPKGTQKAKGSCSISKEKWISAWC